MNKLIGYYVQQLRDKDNENAYHRLLEIDEALVPDLIEAYHTTNNIYIREQLIEIIGEHRRPADVEFLASALKSYTERIWKTALDALVKLGSQQCVDVLIEQRSKLQKPGRIEWVDEAIIHLESQLFSENG
jgi:HEAT repeat protein